MVSFKFTPSTGSAITFSRTAAHYRLLKAYDGLTKVPITHLTTKAPYQDGETRVDSQMTPREVTLDIMVVADSLTDQQVYVRALATCFNPKLGEGVLTYTDDSGNAYNLYCVGDGTPTVSPDERGTYYQRVLIDLIAHDPHWYSDTHIAYLKGTGTTFFPFSFPFTLGSNTDTETCTNSGSVDAPVTITIDGDITNPVIENTTTSESLTLTIDMSANDYFVITTEFGNKTATYWKNGNREVNGFPYLSADSTFWGLQPGANIITLTDDDIAAGTEVRIEWEDKYPGI